MDGTISKGTRAGQIRKKSGGPFSLISPLSKSGIYYYRNPTSYLKLAAEEVGIPLTVKILDGDLTDDLNRGAILTMHKILDVVKLKCIKPNGDFCEVPVELDADVEAIKVMNSECYDTVGDVLQKRKKNNVMWIVVTKPFVYQNTVYNPGTIFEVLPEAEEGSEFMAVEVYPGRLMVFLPTHIRGMFYKIGSPFDLKKQKLSKLKDEQTPMIIVPKVKSFPQDFLQTSSLTNERLLVTDKKTERFVVASSIRGGEYYIHVFPLVIEVSCEILLGGVPVDILRQKEINKIEKKLLSMADHTIDYAMSMPYKTAGIERSKLLKNKGARLKKKDITLPESLLDEDYSRYIAKPTSLMRELGDTINGQSNEAPTLVRMNTIARRPKLNNNNNEERTRNRESITNILKRVDLEQYEEVFFNEQIDCKLLTKFDLNDFLELGLTEDEVKRLYTSIHEDEQTSIKGKHYNDPCGNNDSDDQRDSILTTDSETGSDVTEIL